MFSVRRAFIGAALVAMTSMACSAILGIEIRPVLESGDDGGERGLDGGTAAVEAGSCPFTEALPCRAGCAHAFCEDFEDAGALFARWVAPTGFISPFVLGDASVGVSEPGLSSSNGLSIVVHGDVRASAALLLHRLPEGVVGDAGDVDGIRISFDARVERAELAEAGGPDPDAGAALLAFLGSGEDKVSGPGLALGERDILLFASTDILRGGNTELEAKKVTAGHGLTTFVNVWARLSLFAGSASRARALEYGACPDVPYVFAASWGLARTCVAAPAAFPPAALPIAPTIAVGPVMSARGEVSLRYDNVFVDVFRAP